MREREMVVVVLLVLEDWSLGREADVFCEVRAVLVQRYAMMSPAGASPWHTLDAKSM